MDVPGLVSADLVAGSAGVDIVARSANADTMRARRWPLSVTGLGWLAASSACVRGPAVLPPPPPAIRPFAGASWLSSQLAKHKCASTLYCVSLALKGTHFCGPPFTLTTTSPFSTPCRYGTHNGGPAGAPRPSFPSPPFGCPYPAPFTSTCFSFFSTTPFIAPPPPPLLVVCPPIR